MRVTQIEWILLISASQEEGPHIQLLIMLGGRVDGVSLAMIDTFKIIGPSTQKMTFLWSIRNSIGHNFITSRRGWIVCICLPGLCLASWWDARVTGGDFV